ncbi:UNVERIFIED_CONTAM: hypothetical protein RMT77_005473 [Armadillidium vulgare]
MAKIYKQPENLVKLSLKTLVNLTISCLEYFQDFNSRQKNFLSSQNLNSKNLDSKKREREFDDFDESRRKRRRRNSFCSSESKYQNLPDFTSTSKDDYYIPKCTLVDSVIILKNYYKCLPQNLWNMFFISIVKILNENRDLENSSLELNSFELLFSRKVSSFSTKLMTIDVIRKCEKFICERIHICKSLRYLHIAHNISPKNIDVFILSLGKLQHLTSVCLNPEEKQSFHCAIPVLANCGKHLKELQIVYSCSLLKPIGSIDSLICCENLKTLLLYSYGIESEAEHVEQLLINLKDLNYFYHRELPSVIIDIYRRNNKQNGKDKILICNLKKLSLAIYCKSVGTHLCYFPDESVANIGNVCPYITQLTTIRPSNLNIIANSMKSLTSLEIHDCTVEELFSTPVSNNTLENILYLNLHNIENLDYKCIILLSTLCPNLESLEITHCNLFASSYFLDLQSANKTLFPHLRKLNIQRSPRTEQVIPILLHPHVMDINKNLFRHLLSKVPNLQKLYLDFGTDYVESGGFPSIPEEEELIYYISQCKDLKELMLISCPNVTYNVISNVVRSCPKLNRLWNVDLWEIPPAEFDKILRHYSYLFFQSFKR